MTNTPLPYETLEPAVRATRVIGQIFWIPAYLAMQELMVVRLGRWDRLSPITTAEFAIKKEVTHNLGRNFELYHHMPLPELKLKMNEELVVKKVKRRPGILIVREGVNPRKLATFISGIGDKPNPTEHVFAPIISLKKEDNISADYPEEFVTKVMNDQFPEFLYLPADGTVLKNDSMAVLTQLQTHNINMIEATSLRFAPLEFAAKLNSFYNDLEGQLLP